VINLAGRSVNCRATAAGWILDVGAALMRTETELVLKSRGVVPARRLAGGFEIRYPR
jgi:hypothetical protein